MYRLFFIFLISMFSLLVKAQLQEIRSERIASLQVVAGQDWLEDPVIILGGGQSINISFDELTHDSHRYSYTVTHCEPDWSDSEGLFASDYISGFQSGQTLEDYEKSINTNQLFTHYRLTIPNASCRIMMSGNYRVDIIDEDEEEIVASARFMVCEDLVTVAKKITDNTDIDIQRSHQQVNIKVQFPSSLKCVSPREQFKVAVMQNHRTDNMVW